MLKFLRALVILLLPLSLVNCQPNGSNPSSGTPPAIIDVLTLQYAAGVVDFTVVVNPNGSDTTVVIEYGIGSLTDSTVPSDAGAGSVDTDVPVRVSALIEGAMYKYRAVATNSAGMVTGRTQTIVINTPKSPTVAPLIIQKTSESSFSLHTTICPEGRSTSVRFGYYFINALSGVGWGFATVTPSSICVDDGTYYDSFLVNANNVYTNGFFLNEWMIAAWVETTNDLGTTIGPTFFGPFQY